MASPAPALVAVCARHPNMVVSTSGGLRYCLSCGWEDPANPPGPVDPDEEFHETMAPEPSIEEPFPIPTLKRYLKRYHCPECGREAMSAHGVRVHQARSHKGLEYESLKEREARTGVALEPVVVDVPPVEPSEAIERALADPGLPENDPIVALRLRYVEILISSLARNPDPGVMDRIERILWGGHEHEGYGGNDD